MAKINCTIPSGYHSRSKKPFDKNELTDIRLKAKTYNKIMAAAAAIPTAQSKEVLERLSRTEALNTLERLTANLISVAPEQSKRLQDYLVKLFAQKNRLLGLDPSTNFTVAGEIRYNLLDAQQTIEGLISLTGRILSNQRLDALVRHVKKLNISKELAAELVDDALTVGQIPRTLSNLDHYRRDVLGNSSSLLEKFQRRRYDDFRQRAKSAGLTDADIDSLIQSASAVTGSFDEVAALARAVGVEIGNQERIGYFSRIVTNDFKLRLEDIGDDGLFDRIIAGDISLSTVFNRGRKTQHYVPSDEVFVSKILGITPTQLDDLLKEPLVWRNYLDASVSADQLDTLVDSGVLQKIPMSSREVFEYYVKQYDLPYKNLTDAFVVNPARVLQKYTTSLQRAAGTAVLLKAVASDEAVLKGWAITSQTRNADPSKFANFVSLGDRLNAWAKRAGVTPEQFYNNLGVKTDFVSELSQIHLHPVVADQLLSVLEINSNPNLLGSVAAAVHNWGRRFNKSTLLSSNIKYITHTALSNSIQAVAAGANALFFVPSIIDTFRVLSKGLDGFDDARPFRTVGNKTYTKKELFHLFLVKRGQSITPGVTHLPYELNFHATSKDVVDSLLAIPGNVKKSIGDVLLYTFAHGNPVNGKTIPAYERIGRLGKAVTQQLDQLLSDTFAPIALVANLMDMAFKWATFQSILDEAGSGRSIANGIGQVLTSLQYKKFSDVDSAFRHLDEYFVNGFDVGVVTQKLSHYAVPFALYRMSNPPMQLRHMLRNPHLYMAYHRLRALNQVPLGVNEDVTESGIPDWMLDEYPSFVGYNEDGKPYISIPSSYDPISDAFVFAKETGEDIARIGFGAKVGSTAELREQVRGESTGRFFDDIASQLFTPWKVAIEQFIGRDTFSGRTFSDIDSEEQPTFLGVRVNARTKNILDKVPLLSNLNRANPFEIGGTAPRYDVNGNVIEKGKPSWLGTTRTDTDKSKYNLKDEPLFIRVLDAAGVPVRTIDFTEGNKNTLSDVERTIRKVEENIDRAVLDIQQDKINNIVIDPKEKARRIEAVKDLIGVWGQLLVDKQRVTEWLKDKNVLSTSALKELNKLKIRVRELPYPAQEELQKIIDDVTAKQRSLEK